MLCPPRVSALLLLAGLAGCGSPESHVQGQEGADGRNTGFGRPAVLARNDGEARMLQGRKPIWIKVDSRTLGPRTLTAGMEDTPPGDSIGVHKHLQEDEVAFVHIGKRTYRRPAEPVLSAVVHVRLEREFLGGDVREVVTAAGDTVAAMSLIAPSLTVTHPNAFVRVSSAGPGTGGTPLRFDAQGSLVGRTSTLFTSYYSLDGRPLVSPIVASAE